MFISPFTLIGDAWQFYKKQPLLNQVLGWLLIIPLTLSSLVQFGLIHFKEVIMQNGITILQLTIVGIIIELLFTIWVLWGYGAVLTIGQRIIKSAAGRTRSSFSSVKSQGKTLVVPLLLTSIIRECVTLLLCLPYFLVVLLYLLSKSPEQINAFIAMAKSVALQEVISEPAFPLSITIVLLVALPLLIPVVLYRIRTSLYHIVISNEGSAYRSALRKSSTIVTGQTWSVFLSFVGITICTFIPVAIIVGAIGSIITTFDPRLDLITIILNGTGTGFAVIIYLLATIGLYKHVTTSKN